ncbi:JAB-like toxin 1 domain-containing protein [Chryseobacterium gleum]|uniref:JAB-like toxin 1 domain-containing protein n=1 Tax=Chryseobacterium gleum TaxID=250 RepID=UPI001E4DFBE8|nr:JAB-like toxin 1 domain-containing protein [Chryseobacterium gleum]MCD9618027.1 hypothetical protein [Chryseobacterium gleum]
MVIDPDGNDIQTYTGDAAVAFGRALQMNMSTSSETSGGNIFTGFASNLFGDDYILNRNGKFERISETKYNYDRLYNWDKSKVIKLNKEFMKNLRQDMKYDSYSNQYKPTETTITFENSSVSTKQIKNYFYFLAANTEKEWGFNHLTKNGWFSDSSVTIINSNHQDDEVSLSPIFRYLDSGYDLIGSGHSHQMLIYDHPENKHLLKGRYEAINYPS